MEPTPDQIEAGHAFYTKRTLAMYDLAILGYFSRFAWKCRSSRVLAHYDVHVTTNHLDVGVGTGYFLDRCDFGSASPRIALLDLSSACLETAARRISRYRPEIYTANVLEPISIETPRFDSVGINYVLHCLPGDIRSKGVVFSHLAALLNPGGVIFGATLLHDGVHRNVLARRVMDRNNAHGIFHNADDDLDGLTETLSCRLTDPVVEVVGCVAFFSGHV